MIPDAALDDLRARNPVSAIAGRWVRLRRGGKLGLTGPCPLCSPDGESRSAGRFECDADRWVCAVCQDGGDVIRLVEKREGRSFLDAVAWLGGAQEVDPAEAERRARAAAEKRAKAEQAAARFREIERERLWALWREARPLRPGLGWAYLAMRGIDPRWGVHCLRDHEDVPYFVHGAGEDGRVRPREIHRGPAMLAAIIDGGGRFSGLHFTWIDLARPKGKAELADPATGEILPAKKVRGSKQGGRIELVRHSAPRRLFLGEGIETVLSVHRALVATARLSPACAFWSAVDLGNLGGRAAESVPHPGVKGAGGRALRVPGPVPDLDAPAIPIPDSVEHLVLLADGDSDRFTTQAAMERARARYSRNPATGRSRTIRIAWPPEGRDFNDLLVV